MVNNWGGVLKDVGEDSPNQRIAWAWNDDRA